jgi:UDP-N-acetylmuramoyl-L-alanyl-D-glutamate--2,6-diaminopimelate ligase
MAMVIGAGESLNSILPLVPLLKSVIGRMEFIGSTPTGADVYVDYAHTPDALERALMSLRAHTEGRVWVVFGCGGDRDITKRPIMGKIAAYLSDEVIVTDDNPRNEDPASIRRQIIGSFGFKEIADRSDAIMYCVEHLEKGDSLLIAGKGHEMGQIIGDKIFPFSDKKQAEIVLAGMND